VLVFPAKSADTGLPCGFHDRNIDNYSTNLAMAIPALIARKVDQSPIGYGLDKTVAQEVQRNARRPNCLAVRHTFLDFCIGESPIRGKWLDRSPACGRK
jgi:hypothetical protein